MSAPRPSRVLALVSALCLSLAGLGVVPGPAGPSPAAAQAPATPVGVDTVRAVEASQTTPLIGRLVARQAGVVAARTPGLVESFPARVGDRVEAGDVLATLDRQTLTLARTLAEADASAASAGLAEAQARLARAEQEMSRLVRLRKSAAFSQGKYDDQRRTVEEAAGAVQTAEAALARARAAIALTDVDLADAVIRAPYPGVISERHTEVGSYVPIGAAVVSLVNDRDMELEADVPYALLNGLAPGVEVRVALPGVERAKVRAVVPSENPRTRTRLVRFDPVGAFDPDASAHHAANQSVTLHIPVDGRAEVLSVHKDAVVAGPQGDIVFVVAEGTAQIRPVTLGRAIGNRFEVVSGLAPGDVTVIRGNERLRPGQPVVPNDAAPAEGGSPPDNPS